MNDFRGEIDVTVARAERSHQQLEAELKKADEKLKNFQARTAKLRLLTSATMSDLSKELEFWRDTIRRIVVSNTGDKKAAENLITQVTHALESWRTRGKISKDFDRLKMAAHWLNEMEESKKEI